MADDILDVAIVGAGISGTYCAYRLQQDTDLKISVFEANDRVGGRLWSHHWKDADAIVELGGEGFSPFHAHVATLAWKELKLDVVPHNAFNSVKRLFLRNSLLHPEDFMKRSSFPSDKTKGTDTLLRYYVSDDYFVHPKGSPEGTIDDLQPAIAHAILKELSPEVKVAYDKLMAVSEARAKEMQAEAAAQGHPDLLPPDIAMGAVTPEIAQLIGDLIVAVENSTAPVTGHMAQIVEGERIRSYNLDFWSFLVTVLDQESYRLYRESGYDNTSALAFNLVELVENLLLNGLMGFANPGFWTIKGGYDQLPKALMARAEAQGVGYQGQMRLSAITRQDDGTIALSMTDAEGNKTTVLAHKVVYTAPLALLDSTISLAGFDASLTERFHKLRQGVTAVEAGKLYLAFPDAWWTRMTDLGDDPEPLFGYGTTDMPPQAFYYKGYCGDGKKGLMAGALADASSLDFWTGFLSPLSPVFPGTAPEEHHTLGAPATMVSAAYKMLGTIHADAYPGTIPRPEMALYYEWREGGAAWSAWKSGRNIHEDATALRRPFATGYGDQHLYCCGDSVAERHGWVENTIDSAEKMLREAFGLKPAPWLP